MSSIARHYSTETAKTAHQTFLNNIEIIGNSNDFQDQKLCKVLSQPIIDSKLIFALDEICANSEHIWLFNHIQKLYDLADEPQHFTLLRNQLEQNLYQISEFYVALREGVNSDLLYEDSNRYRLGNPVVIRRNVHKIAINSVNYVALIKLLSELLKCCQKCFPELLNSKNASLICKLLSRFDYQIKIDLDTMSKFAQVSNPSFLNELIKCYWKKLDKDKHILQSVKLILDKEIPDLSLDLLKNLPCKRFARVLKDDSLTLDEIDQLSNYANDDVFNEYLHDFKHDHNHKEVSVYFFKHLTLNFVKHYKKYDINQVTHLLGFVKVPGVNQTELIDHFASCWFSLNKYSILKILAEHKFNYSSVSDKMVFELLKKWAFSLDVSYLSEWSVIDLWGKILDKFYLVDGEKFAEWILQDENQTAFNLISKQLLQSLISQYVDPFCNMKKTFNIIIKFFLWTASRKTKEFELNMEIAPFDQFINLLKKKRKIEMTDNYQCYQYQQKVIQLLKSQNLSISDIPLIEHFIDKVRKCATIDNHQICFDENVLILHHDSEKIITQDRWQIQMLDGNGYLVWNIHFDSDHHIKAMIFKRLIFVFNFSRDVIQIHDLVDGSCLNSITLLDNIPLQNSFRCVRPPLTLTDNRWFFVINSQLRYFVFDETKLEFVPDGKDDNFPTDASGHFFNFHGVYLTYGYHSFGGSRVSVYSITERKFVNQIQEQDMTDFRLLNDAVCYTNNGVLHILHKDQDSTFNLTSDQTKDFILSKCGMIQKDSDFCISLYCIYNRDKPLILFTKDKQLIEIQIDDFENKKFTDFYPTDKGVVFQKDKKLIFTGPSGHYEREISPEILFNSKTKIEYSGFENGFHIFYKKNK